MKCEVKTKPITKKLILSDTRLTRIQYLQKYKNKKKTKKNSGITPRSRSFRPQASAIIFHFSSTIFVSFRLLIRLIILHDRNFSIFVFETVSPPSFLQTNGFRLQNKAFGLNRIEEQFAHKIGGTRVGHFETGTESETYKNKKNSIIGFCGNKQKN